MSQKVASLYATIGADTSGFEKGAKNVKRELTGIAPGVESASTKLKNFAQNNAMLLGFLSSAAILAGKGIKYSIEQAAEAEKVDAKLAAVLISTGGAAGMTAGELNKMALSLSRLSVYDDEAIKSSEALLLTFTKVGKEVFPEAQQAILNMSSALGQDLQSSTIQLGKALNDPIAGITALKRVGVSFTEEQREMIKVMVAAGDTLGAQKLILHELTVEFGGQALAALNTYEGKVKSLKNEFGNLAEVVGEDTLPVLSDFVDFVNLSVRGWASFIEGAKRTAEIRREAIALRDALDPSNPQWQDYIGMAIEMEGAQKRLNDEFKAANGILEDEFLPSIEDLDKAEQKLQDANYDLVTSMLDITKTNENFRDGQAEINKKLVALYDERNGLYSWEVDKIQAIDDKVADLTDEFNANQEEYKKNWQERMSLMAIEAIAISDGVKGFSEAEQEKAIAYLNATGQMVGGAQEQAVAEQMLSAAIAKSAKEDMPYWGEVQKQIMADGVIHIQEVTDAINNMPTGKTVTLSINEIYNRTGMSSLSQSPFYNPSIRHAAGGTFEIPSGYGNEGFRMGNHDTASGGELISITPKGKATSGNNFYITVTADFADPETIARRLKPAVTRVMREAGVV